MQKEPSFRGLQTGKIWGGMAITIFGPKTEFLGPQKTHVSPGPLLLRVIIIMAWTVLPSLVENRPKLRVLIQSKWEWPETGVSPEK